MLGEQSHGVNDWHATGKAAGAECLVAALDYVSRGWAVIPCCPPDHVGVGKEHGKKCASPGKAPLVAWRQYQTELPHRDEIERWWDKWPNANVYIVLGPVSGLVRVDVDESQGEEYLARLSKGDLPPTLEMVTGSGRGLFFHIPDKFIPKITHNHGDKVHEGLSLLGQGAGTVMPPSRHKSGRRYVWVPGRGPDEIETSAMPGWLVEAMKPATKRSGARKATSGDRITEGGRNSRLASLAGAMRRVGANFDTILAALRAENEARFDPPLDDSEVEGIAKSVSRYEPKPQGLFGGAATANGDGHKYADTPKRGWETIRDYLIARYRPAFKIAEAIYSGTELRDVKRIEAIAALPPELIDKLAAAADYPKYATGDIKGPEAAPAFFKKWGGTGWVAMHSALPDEDTVEPGTCAARLAAEPVTQLVREALLTPIVLGQRITGRRYAEGLELSETKLEKRPLAEWCRRFATTTRWEDIRELKIWSKMVNLGDGESKTRIALRHEVFSQIKADRRLIEMGPTKFTSRCQRYGIGKPGGQGERPHGKWALILDDGFVADLIGSVDVEDVG